MPPGVAGNPSPSRITSGNPIGPCHVLRDEREKTITQATTEETIAKVHSAGFRRDCGASPSRFWPASLQHGRLIGHLAVVHECIDDDALTETRTPAGEWLSGLLVGTSLRVRREACVLCLSLPCVTMNGSCRRRWGALCPKWRSFARILFGLYGTAGRRENVPC